jgi:hypothetical protein
MQRLEVSGAVRPIYGSLGVKRLNRNMGDTVNVNSCKGFQSAVSGPLVVAEFYSGGSQTDASVSLK